MAYRTWSRPAKAVLWSGIGVAALGGGYFLYRKTRSAATPTATSPTATAPGATTTSSGGTGATQFTVSLTPSQTATNTGRHIALAGTIHPTLPSGTQLEIVDQHNAVLATVSSGNTIAVSITESTPGAYAVTWRVRQGGATVARGSHPLQLLWVTPSASNAAALFQGEVGWMQSYLAQYPVSPGTTAQAALSLQLQDDLNGTEFGKAVAGLKHTEQNGVVTNTLLPFPSGVTPRYVTLGADPIATGLVLIGKYAGNTLWQVYAATPSGSGTGSSSSSASALAAAKAQYQQLTQQASGLQSQVRTQQSDIQSLEAAVSQLTAELQQLKS